MSVDRWEKERSGWVLARADRSLSARRRGEKLALAARRRDRYAAGSDDAVQSEVITRSLFYRITFREEGGMNTLGWFMAASFGFSAFVFIAGPAYILGNLAYAAWWYMVAKWGRLFPGPYLGMAAVLTGLSWFIVGRLGLEGFAGFLVQYTAVQLVLGLVIAAWLTRSWGWPAVARKVKQSQVKVKPIHIVIPVDDETTLSTAATAATSTPEPVKNEEIPSPVIAPFEILIDIPDEDNSATTNH